MYEGYERKEAKTNASALCSWTKKILPIPIPIQAKFASRNRIRNN